MGGRVEYVMGSYRNITPESTVRCVQVNVPSNTTIPVQKDQVYIYDLRHNPNETTDYGCSAELMMIIWQLQCSEMHWDLSGLVQAENVVKLAKIWESDFCVQTAPSQEDIVESTPSVKDD